MLKGEAVALRLVRDDDLPLLERWMADPEAAAGSYQRYQLEHGRALTHLFHQNGLVTRDSGFLIIQLLAEDKPIAAPGRGQTHRIRPLRHTGFP